MCKLITILGFLPNGNVGSKEKFGSQMSKITREQNLNPKGVFFFKRSLDPQNP